MLLTGITDYKNGTKDFKNFKWNHENELTMTKLRRKNDIAPPPEIKLKRQPDDPMNGLIVLEPQRIRAFMIEYSVQEETSEE